MEKQFSAGTIVADHGSPEADLIVIVQELARELHPGRSRFVDVSSSSQLERDLGIDSLGRTELILRIERAFRVRLPIQTIGEADTVGDLLHALQEAGPHRDLVHGEAAIAPSLPLVPAAAEARTLIEVLDWHAERHPDRLHLTVLQDDSTVIGTMTYGELAKTARLVAAGLIQRDIAPGDRVALMLPTSLDFFSGLFGILYAGAVPVPIYPPMRMSQLDDHLRRQAGILRNAGARILVTMPEGLRLAGLLRGQVETLSKVESIASLAAEPPAVQLPLVTDAGSTALIQYTSGSTGDPKGVVLSHVCRFRRRRPSVTG